MRKARLRVYGWSGFRTGLQPTPQTREIVAARSIEAVYRAFPGWLSRSDIVETRNDLEITTAMAKPGVVFFRQVYAHPVVFIEGEPLVPEP